MLQVTEKVMEEAKATIALGEYDAAGYRVMVKTIGVSTGMELFEQELYPTLAAGSFDSKTEDQREKEERGRQYGVIVSIGNGAFKAPALGGVSWAEEGDVVFFDRYAGVEMEFPPGSKNVYRVMNDESLIGRVKPKMEAKL